MHEQYIINVTHEAVSYERLLVKCVSLVSETAESMKLQTQLLKVHIVERTCDAEATDNDKL